MKIKNTFTFNIIWLIAIILLILYFMGNVGVWALWVAGGLMVGPIVIVILLSLLIGIFVAAGESYRKK